jgi:hypothetical protein
MVNGWLRKSSDNGCKGMHGGVEGSAAGSTLAAAAAWLRATKQGLCAQKVAADQLLCLLMLTLLQLHVAKVGEELLAPKGHHREVVPAQAGLQLDGDLQTGRQETK